jgi:hypothetical protein
MRSKHSVTHPTEPLVHHLRLHVKYAAADVSFFERPDKIRPQFDERLFLHVEFRVLFFEAQEETSLHGRKRVQVRTYLVLPKLHVSTIQSIRGACQCM